MEKKHLTLQDRHNIEQMLNARKSFTALRITGKPEQNEETDALQEADQYTNSAKGKASDSTADSETDWPRHLHMSCVRYSASPVRKSLTTACVLTEYIPVPLPAGEGEAMPIIHDFLCSSPKKYLICYPTWLLRSAFRVLSLLLFA